MSKPPTVAVFGATGLIGRPVTQALAEAGLTIRAATRDVRAASAVLPEGCDVRPCSLRDLNSIRELLDGADAAYISLPNRMSRARPNWDPDTDGTRAIIDACKACGVSHILKLSAMGVDEAVEDWWVARAKVETDQAIINSGLEFTIFRPTWFMESICLSALGPFLLHMPSTDDPLYWIAGEDFGRQVAESVKSGRGSNSVLDVQGPVGMTMKKAFQVFNRIWRAYLLPIPMPRTAVRAGALAMPALDYLNRLLDMTFEHVVHKAPEGDSNCLHQPRITMEQFAKGLLDSRSFPSKSGG